MMINFVADAYKKDLIGGAELTTDALISSAPKNININSIYSNQVTASMLKAKSNEIWIITNFASMDMKLLPLFKQFNIQYYVVEYDYKYCQYRLPQLHEYENIRKNKFPAKCDCAFLSHGKLIYSFYLNACSTFWMSDKQRLIYSVEFPKLVIKNSYVLHSIFDKETINKIKKLKKLRTPEDYFLIFKSNSWVKGTSKSIKYAKSKNFKYKLVGGLSYDKLLEEMSKAKGIIYMPNGYDTCPRFVLEAQMLGLDLYIDEDYIQHIEEAPFESPESTLKYLASGKQQELFWEIILRK